MTIPIKIDQLSKIITSEADSTELMDWLKGNRFQKILELSKYLEFPLFKEGDFSKQVLRSWLGRKVLSEMSNTIIIPNDKNGVLVLNTIENLLDSNSKVSTLDILKTLPNQEITLDFDNLILIISSWKKKLAEQQNLVSKLNSLEEIDKTFPFKHTKELVKDKDIDIKPIKIQLKVDHRDKPLSIELWKSKKQNFDKEIIIFMPGFGGDIENFRWLGSKLSNNGWPILFIEHDGSDSNALKSFMDGDSALPGGADFYLYRIKDLNAVINAHKNGYFGENNESYILMGHSLGSLIAFLHEGSDPIEGLNLRCDKALKDFALTNLSKLLQCQLSELSLPKLRRSNRLKALIGFNTFGSLIWPNKKSLDINAPVLLIGGTYDLITPITGEQLKVFSSITGNSLNRFLIIEGASHFSPIRVKNKNFKKIYSDDVFKINETFIGHYPNDVQNLALEVIIQFLNDIDNKKGLKVVKNQDKYNLKFHILDNQRVRDISSF